MSQSVEEHYDAFACILESARQLGEARLHFGVAPHAHEADYCWFKTISQPGRHCERFSRLCDEVSVVEFELIGQRMKGDESLRVVDVGCGTGATLEGLLARYPQHSYAGVNLHAKQASMARELLNDKAAVFQEDFLAHRPRQLYDLAYFCESAFHFSDKRKLAQALSSVLAPGGQASFADIVVSERMGSALSRVGGEDSLFHFAPTSHWEETFASQGLKLIEVKNLGVGVAHHIQVSPHFDELMEEYFAPHLHGQSNVEGLTSTLREIHKWYKRLGQLLRRGQLEYVVLRFEREL